MLAQRSKNFFVHYLPEDSNSANSQNIVIFI
jgi:hypothetical protein